MNRRFLIVTASYNRPELLLRNIHAQLKQTYADWLHIIVDDGSSLDMQEAFALAQHDKRIILIKAEKNQGCNATRNTALNYIRQNQLSGFVSFVDDDDYLLPEALQTVNELMDQTPGYQWYTADCCYPDGKKASRLARHGQLSYLKNYMFGREIKGDLNHFIDSQVCADIRFTDWFRNGQEWTFYSQLASTNDFYAFEKNIKVVEYLEDGLTRKNVNSQDKLKVFQLKVIVLEPLVSKKLLSGQQLLLVRELLNNAQCVEALALLKSIARYQWISLKFYRYFIKAYISSLKVN
jgi:glycosyltransferase involved in cell wall biosynthesis